MTNFVLIPTINSTGKTQYLRAAQANDGSISLSSTAADVSGNPIVVALDSSVEAVAAAIQALTSRDAGLATDAHLVAQTAAIATGNGALAEILAKQPTLNDDGGALVHVTNFPATQPVSLAAAPALVAGTAVIGKVGIDQTTPGTTNGVVVNGGSVTAKPPVVTPADRSVPISASGAGGSPLFPANANRTSITFQVPAALTGGIYLSWTGASGNGTAGSYFFPAGTALVTLDASVVGLGAITYYVPTAPGAPVYLPASEG